MCFLKGSDSIRVCFGISEARENSTMVLGDHSKNSSGNPMRYTRFRERGMTV